LSTSSCVIEHPTLLDLPYVWPWI